MNKFWTTDQLTFWSIGQLQKQNGGWGQPLPPSDGINPVQTIIHIHFYTHMPNFISIGWKISNIWKFNPSSYVTSINVCMKTQQPNIKALLHKQIWPIFILCIKNTYQNIYFYYFLRFMLFTCLLKELYRKVPF